MLLLYVNSNNERAEKEMKLKCLESQGSTKSASQFQGFACAGRKIPYVLQSSSTLTARAQSTSHYTTWLSQLI